MLSAFRPLSNAYALQKRTYAGNRPDKISDFSRLWFQARSSENAWSTGLNAFWKFNDIKLIESSRSSRLAEQRITNWLNPGSTLAYIGLMHALLIILNDVPQSKDSLRELQIPWIMVPWIMVRFRSLNEIEIMIMFKNEGLYMTSAAYLP